MVSVRAGAELAIPSSSKDIVPDKLSRFTPNEPFEPTCVGPKDVDPSENLLDLFRCYSITSLVGRVDLGDMDLGSSGLAQLLKRRGGGRITDTGDDDVLGVARIRLDELETDASIGASDCRAIVSAGMYVQSENHLLK